MFNMNKEGSLPASTLCGMEDMEGETSYAVFLQDRTLKKSSRDRSWTG